MIFDRELAEKLRALSIPSSISIVPPYERVNYKQAADGLEQRERLLGMLSQYLEDRGQVNDLLLTLDAHDVELLSDYFGWSLHPETPEPFDDFTEDDDWDDGLGGGYDDWPID